MIHKIYNEKYVAAMIKGTVGLKRWLNTVPDDVLETLRIDRLNTDDYPVNLIECKLAGQHVFMHAMGELPLHVEGLKGMGIKKMTTYTITEDFLGDPKNPGLDYMGILNHDHVGDDDEVSD